ncbi:hypothetical protein OTU49_016478, partial [Cherax quadricarinatus]
LVPAFSGDYFEISLWQLNNNNDDYWHNGRFPLPDLLMDNVQVEFIATRLEGNWSLGHSNGLIYLDDVEILSSSDCTLLPPDAVPSSTTPTMSTAVPTVTPSEASCNFSNKNF